MDGTKDGGEEEHFAGAATVSAAFVLLRSDWPRAQWQ